MFVQSKHDTKNSAPKCFEINPVFNPVVLPDRLSIKAQELVVFFTPILKVRKRWFITFSKGKINTEICFLVLSVDSHYSSVRALTARSHIYINISYKETACKRKYYIHPRYTQTTLQSTTLAPQTEYSSKENTHTASDSLSKNTPTAPY